MLYHIRSFSSTKRYIPPFIRLFHTYLRATPVLKRSLYIYIADARGPTCNCGFCGLSSKRKTPSATKRMT